MRISVLKDDPGYRGEGPYALDVLVDGEVMHDVHTADEEKGEVWCHARDREGKFIIDQEKQALYEVCYRGTVKLRPIHGQT